MEDSKSKVWFQEIVKRNKLYKGTREQQVPRIKSLIIPTYSLILNREKTHTKINISKHSPLSQPFRLTMRWVKQTEVFLFQVYFWSICFCTYKRASSYSKPLQIFMISWNSAAAKLTVIIFSVKDSNEIVQYLHWNINVLAWSFQIILVPIKL